MKQCPYCGKEYPDEFIRCPVDDTPLTGGELTAIAMDPPPLPPPTDELWDRRLNIFALVVVCAVAFGTSILASVYYLFFPTSGIDASVVTSGTMTNTPRQIYSWLVKCVHESSALGLLAYILMQRRQSFRSLGLTWTWKDLGLSIPVLIVASMAHSGLYEMFYFSGLTAVRHHSATNHVGDMLFGGGISFMTLVFQVINPFFEELIVRAYVMTEVKRLTHSATKAVIISVVLQTSYHFYQGVPLALSEGMIFLIFSLFYARTNRITPVILAHLWMDMSGTLWFMLHR